MGRWGRVVLLGTAVAVAAAGCAGPAGGPGAPQDERLPGTPQVRPRWTSCATEAPTQLSSGIDLVGGNDALTLPRLGDGFVPAAAVVCAQRPQRRPDGGEDLVATESRAKDVAALVAALRLPDEPLTDAPCTADLPMVPWLVLLDAQGRWVRPGVPRDGCGKIRIEVRKAVRALRLTRTTTRPIRQLESAQAAAAGCSQSWADMVWVATSTGQGDRSAAVDRLFPRASRVRLCVYRVAADQQRTGKPAGDFSYGGALTAGRWTAIERAIRAAGPARACAEPAGRFAVLLATTGGGEVYVELDGCRRVLVTGGSGRSALRQAEPALLALLAARPRP